MAFGPPLVDFAGGLGGIADAFTGAYDAAQKKTALQKLGGLVATGDYDAAAQAAFATGDIQTGTALAKMSQSSKAGAQADKLLSPLLGGGATSADTAPSAPAAPRTMRMPADPEVERKAIDTWRSGGLTNPFGLAALAAHSNAESGFSPGNITGSWADPSQSGQPGTSGGMLSWRDDRLAKMRDATAGSPDPVVAQAKYALVENPEVSLALQNAKSLEEANSILAASQRYSGWNSAGGETASRLASARGYYTRFAGSGQPAAPMQVASAEPVQSGAVPDPMGGGGTISTTMIPRQGGGFVPVPPARPTEGAPVRVASADPNFAPQTPGRPAAAPTAAPDGSPALVAGVPAAGLYTTRDQADAQAGRAPAAPAGAPAAAGADRPVVVPGFEEDGPYTLASLRAKLANPKPDEVYPTEAQVRAAQGGGAAPSGPAAVSASAPQQLADAGFPAGAVKAVANTEGDPQKRIGVLMRALMIPGLDEGRTAVVKMLISAEQDKLKQPDAVRQFLFAKSAAGGGYQGSFSDWQNKDKENDTTDIRNYNTAKAGGYSGSFTDYLTKYKNGSGDGPKVIPSGGALVGPDGKVLYGGATAASMPDQTADFLAERVLAGDNRALVGLGRGAQGAENLSRIQGLVAQKAAERGIDASDILHNIAVAQGMGAEQRSLGTSAGRMAAAAYEAQGAIQLGLEASNAVPRTGFVPLNRAIQMVQANTGDPALKQFVAANNTIINTFARAISPTGTPTVSDKDHAREMLSTADSPEAYAAVLQQMQKEIDMAHKAPTQAKIGLEKERQAAKGAAGPAAFSEGATATNPDTGAKIIYRGGAWVPQ